MVNIPYFKIHSNQSDLNAIKKILDRGTYWADGEEIKEYEELICKYLKCKHSLVFSSGTTALHAMLLAYGIGKGDEVIVPSFTFIATANSVIMTGAKPVFADIENKTYALDLESVEKTITPKTKAIMPIHYAGHPAIYTRELKELADDNELFLFEDAAQAFGANIGGKCIGRFGNCAMFSGCQDKVLTTGEGGILVTEDKNIYDKLKIIRSHGRNENMEYTELGYNYRMPTMIAALGMSRIKRVHSDIAKRRKIADTYNARLHRINQVKRIEYMPHYFNVYQKYPIEVDEKDRDNLRKHLSDNNIGTKVDFSPIHHTKYYKELGYDDKLLETERISKRILCLPVYHTMNAHEIGYVCDKIKEYYDN
jgi:perosamine synthetase